VRYVVTDGAVHRGHGTVRYSVKRMTEFGATSIQFRLELVLEVKPSQISVYQFSGSRSVLRGSKRIRDQIPGYPWIHFCNGTVKFTYFCS